MNLRFLKIILACLAMWLPSGLHAAVNVQAKLDSAYIVMGRTTELHLTVTQPKGVKGRFPLLEKINQSYVVPVCGDSVELRSPSKIDTVENGNTWTLKFDIPVQAFDSGYYRLPEMVYVAGQDSASSKALYLKVVPVKATADEPINDYASAADPDGASIFDHLPDWIVDFWWVILILLLAIAAFLYGLRRYRREGHILPKKPEPTPFEAAMASLRDLKSRKLWEQGLEKDYYTRLTDILRTYLEGRFGINAVEMTSREILQALKSNPEIAEHRQMMRQILDMADFVKFAKVRPLPEDNVKSFDNALRFVESTKPAPVETPSDKGKERAESRENIKDTGKTGTGKGGGR